MDNYPQINPINTPSYLSTATIYSVGIELYGCKNSGVWGLSYICHLKGVGIIYFYHLFFSFIEYYSFFMQTVRSLI